MYDQTSDWYNSSNTGSSVVMAEELGVRATSFGTIASFAHHRELLTLGAHPPCLCKPQLMLTFGLGS